MDGKNKKRTGRPPTINDNVLSKLVEAFSYGMTDAEACLYCGISEAAFYRYVKSHDDFRKQKELLKKSPTIKARLNIVDAIKCGDVDVSKWYVERKAREEFSTRSEVSATINGDALNVDDLSDAIRAYLNK